MIDNPTRASLKCQKKSREVQRQIYEFLQIDPGADFISDHGQLAVGWRRDMACQEEAMDGYRVWVADGGKMAYGGPVQLAAAAT